MSKKKESAFDGFAGFTAQEDWAIISAFIDNLAEFKIVEYIYRNCWDMLTEITIEQFMNGYCDEEGYKVDYGTGLSKPSVLIGIKRAVKHGLIVCEVDDRDKTAIRKYYQIRFDQATVKNLYPDEMEQEEFYEPENDFDIAEQPVKDLYIEEMALEAEKDSLPPSNNSNNTPTMTCSNGIRIQSLETLPEKVYSNKAHKANENYPAFIRAVLKYLSIELGDGEHIASNIAQASKIYKQSDMSEEAFTTLLYDLEAVARNKRGIKRVNSQGWPNRMPFYFACLKKSVAVTNNC